MKNETGQYADAVAEQRDGLIPGYHVRFADWHSHRGWLAQSLAPDARSWGPGGVTVPSLPFVQDKWFRTRQKAEAFAARLCPGGYPDDVADHLKHPSREDAFAVSISTEFIHPDTLDLFVDFNADDLDS